MAFALGSTLGVAQAAGLHLDRVELLSTDPGVWVNYDLPGAGPRFTTAAVRFVEQVQPVLSMPVDGLYVGLSWSSQSVSYERPFGDLPLGWAGGVQTLWLLPRGAFAELTADLGPVRLGAGLSLLSQASWARLSGYDRWDPLPAFTLGWINRRHGQR